jgi:tRNA A37 threonylcarbamoyladenosine synthetase subunit TsaC/SUA5/YrdC
VTLVFNRLDTLPKELNPGNANIGIRIPNYKFIIELAKYCNEPIALTSANISNEPSSLRINVSLRKFYLIFDAFVFKEFKLLWDKLDLVVDGGTLDEDPKFKAGSTVIDLTCKGKFKIIRDGSHYERVLELLQNDCKLVKIND